MKTAIIGLPMVGKTSLFTILTGVHEATRVGLMEARIGITQVPDARLALTHVTGGGIAGLDHGACAIHIFEAS